jgi:hypothetical protein
MPIISDDVYRGALIILQRKMSKDDANEALHRAVIVVLEAGVKVRLPQYLVRAAMWQHTMAARRRTKQPKIAQRFDAALSMAPQLVEHSTQPARQLEICAVSQALERVPQAQLEWLADYIAPSPGVRASLRRGRASRAIAAVRAATQEATSC